MTNPIRQYIKLVEAAYEIERWHRWWANMNTGELVPVTAPSHDEYLFDHLDDFLDRVVIDDIMADAWDPEDYHEKIDDILYAVYDRGWQAVIYDGNNGCLSLRTSGQPRPQAFAKIASTINKTLPVLAVIVDLGSASGTSVFHRITDPAKVKRFLRTGQMV